VDERALREALRGQPDPLARERGRRVVLAAHAAREPVRRRPPWRAALAAVLVSVVAAAGVAAAAAPHSGVGRWVRDVLSVGGSPPPRATPALGRLPGGGRLLVQAGSSVWTVAPDGAKRRLGAFDGASWSPQGMFVAAWRGRELTALEPGGTPRWSLSAPGRVAGVWWGPVDGYRVAYVAGGGLRVVNGDGTGDRALARVKPGIAPTWRPDDAHVLAYADARGHVTVTAVDLGRRLFRSPRLPGLRALAWSADGRRLLIARRERLTVIGAHGPLHERTMSGVEHVAGGPRFAVVRSRPDGSGEVLLLSKRLRSQRLFSAPGRFGAPTWGPGGRTLLVPWPAANQWLFLHRARAGRAAAVGRVARQFSPGAERAPFPGAVTWCCAGP
jgi:hypothetical protein